MAHQYDEQDISFLAYDDLSSAEYYIVKMNGDGTVDACSAITDVPVGILQTGATTGNPVLVRVAGHSKVVASELMAAGNVISTSSAGKADVISVGSNTTQYVVGIVTRGASGDGVVGECLITLSGRAA